MSLPRWHVDRLAGDVEVLGRRGLPLEQYFAEVGARFRRTVGCDAMCWHTLDPTTRLMTGDASRELVDAGIFTAESAPIAGEGIVASEYLRADVNRFAELAARREPVGILSAETAGRPERSTRYREVLAPAGIPFEMRAAFVARGRTWGAVHIARREERGDFTAADAAAVSAITAAVADGIRSSLRFDAARREGGDGAPGLVVLDRANRFELVTGPARELLAELRRQGIGSDEVPPAAVLALAEFARVGGPGHDAVAVPGRAGWITLHASLPEGESGGRVAIVIERGASPQATAVRLEVHGVTAREREIAALLAQGLSNGEIATRLFLSPYTVQDHVKRLFEKTRVGSRQELIARVFLDDYLPALQAGAPVTSSGQLAG